MTRPQLKALLAVAFIISGACGLIYQIVWFKYLSLALGNTTYAQMIVLSTFLGGLALGNRYLGVRAERAENPVRFYGLLEITIGTYCLLYPWFFQVTGEAFRSIVVSTHLYGADVPFLLLRFLLSAVVLLIPTIAMGGTLPALACYFVHEQGESHRETGMLYFLNTFGGIIGVFFAGFELVELFGLSTTMILTSVLNMLLGGVVLALTLRGGSVSLRDRASPPEAARVAPDSRLVRGMLLIAGISGFAALSYEVLWVRMLINLIGSSTYSFSLVLGAFISGIAAGSFLISRKWLARMNRLRLLIVCQVLIAAGTMAVLPVFSLLPFAFWKIASLLDFSSGVFGLFLGIEFGLCFALMLLPTLFMGMGLPLMVGIVCGEEGEIGNSVGKVFSANTAGTVAGVIVTGAYLIPAVGIQKSFEVGMALNLVAAAIGVFLLRGASAARKTLSIAVMALAAILAAIVNPAWDARIVSSGVYRKFSEKPPATMKEFLEALDPRQMLYYKEGANANVAVIGYPGPEHLRVLAINGKADASSGGDMATQLLVGHIPLFLHQNPHSVFLVGLGSGATAAAALAHPVDSVTCLEITREVVEASSQFRDINGDCLRDPRMKVVIEDAHTYLGTVPDTYDVIISEPSNPWVAGIGNLFSREYFDLCRRRLRPGGTMAQWFHTYETNDEVVRLVLNTFQSVFPHCQIWTPTIDDLVLIGSEQEIQPQPERWESLLRSPTVQQSLSRVSIHSVFALLSVQAMTGEGVYCVTDKGRVNSEIHPLLEFLAPRAYAGNQASELVENADQRANLPDDELLVKRYLNGRQPTRSEVDDALSYASLQERNPRLSYALSRYAVETWGEDFTSRYRELLASEALGHHTGIVGGLRELYRNNPDSTFLIPEFVDNAWREIRDGRSFLRRYPVRPVIEALSRLQGRQGRADPQFMVRAGELCFENGDIREADSVCMNALSLASGGERVGAAWVSRALYIHGTVSVFRGDMHEGLEALKELADHWPNGGLAQELVRRMEWRLRRAGTGN